MATKFDTKQAITPLAQKISRCRLRAVGGIRGWSNWAIEWCQTNSTTTNTVAMWMKFKTKWTITILVQKISPRCLPLTGGSPGQAIKWCQLNYTTNDPGCHGNENWDKTGYNSAHIENIAEPLAPSRGYSWVGYWMTPDKFYHDQPRCNDNEILDKIAYNPSCIRDISDTLASNRGFCGTGYDVSQILRGAILQVVMATKFDTISAITRFVHVYYVI